MGRKLSRGGLAVFGCLIGTDRTGLNNVGNGGIGLYISADNSTIGGSDSGGTQPSNAPASPQIAPAMTNAVRR